MKEIWNDIIGYEGYYQVSSIGRVRSIDRASDVEYSNRKKSNSRFKGRILRPSKNCQGYQQVILHKGSVGKSYRINRLVAEAFIPNPYNLPIVNHKDENPRNNRIENLEWCDYKYNANYGNCRNKMSKSHMGKAKNRKPIVCIETGDYFESSCEAERKIGIRARCIRHACSGEYKTSGGYRWRWATKEEIYAHRGCDSD